MAGAKLTPKQESFAQAYVETGNASEAYRRAYNAENSKPESVWRKAKELVDNGNVAARIDELRAAALERHNLTVDDISRMLQQDRDFARQLETPAAAISATMGLAKLYGYLAEKHEHSGSITVEIRRLSL
jgi:phage terminase small subunit